MAKIMVVDDSMLMTKRIKTIILDAGHDVIAVAGNGMEALIKYKQFKPDLVTMDITMPVMNGIEAVKRIIEVDSNANIIMVSSINEKRMVLEAMGYGAKHYIIKPVNEEKVLKVLKEVLQDDYNYNLNSDFEEEEEDEFF